MGFYQGRALEAHAPRPHSRPGRLRRLARLAAVGAALVALAHVPWRDLRQRFAVITDIRVEDLRYLDARRVEEIAGLRRGQDLFELDCRRARQALMLSPRIAQAQVSRHGLRGVRVRVVERVPVMLVRHGEPWELDSSGVLLPPLAAGVVSDVPLLAGASFDRVPAGAQISHPEVRRGLAWVRALSQPELQLGGEVSEVDTSEPRMTRLILMDGTRVLGPAWPPPLARLSALRVVLSDLKQHGTIASEVDLRFENQVIVRPATPAAAAAVLEPEGGGGLRSPHMSAFNVGR